MNQENKHLTEICGNCGFTFGSHCGGEYYSSFYKMYIPKDYCPGHEGRMNWDKGKGTTFLATNTFKEELEKMRAYIICANDSTEAVVLNDEEKALKEMTILANKHYETVKHSYPTRSKYDHMIFWHLHEVEVIEC